MENFKEVDIPDKEGIVVTVADDNDSSKAFFINVLLEPYQVDVIALKVEKTSCEERNIASQKKKEC